MGFFDIFKKSRKQVNRENQEQGREGERKIREKYEFSGGKVTRTGKGHDFKVVYNVPERINIQNSNKGRKIKSIVYIGTLSSEMIGIKDFLYNYKKIHNWQETIFNIIGSGPHKNELERICVENNLINQIVFKGHLDYNQAMQIVADSSLALLPYRDTPLTRISLPTKLFEYMNASKVIVCPNLPGIIEILGIQNQGIYDVRINDAIYDKINKLFNSKYLILETEQINYNISKKYNINEELEATLFCDDNGQFLYIKRGWKGTELSNKDIDALGFRYTASTNPFNMDELKQNSTLLTLKSEDIKN